MRGCLSTPLNSQTSFDVFKSHHLRQWVSHPIFCWLTDNPHWWALTRSKLVCKFSIVLKSLISLRIEKSRNVWWFPKKRLSKIFWSIYHFRFRLICFLSKKMKIFRYNNLLFFMGGYIPSFWKLQNLYEQKRIWWKGRRTFWDLR